MHSVKDWSAAHQHELKMRRQSELKLKQGLSEVESELDKMEREREQQQEFDDSFLEDQATVEALAVVGISLLWRSQNKLNFTTHRPLPRR